MVYSRLSTYEFMSSAIDASKLVAKNPTGVERATALLLRHLFQLDQDNEYLLFTPRRLPADWLSPNLREVIVAPGKFWTFLRLGEALDKENPDLFFQPGNILPLKLPLKVVMTIHDLAALRLARLYPFKETLLSYLTALQAARRASKIIAVSESTGEDLRKMFAVPESKIEIIYHGPPRGYLKRAGQVPATLGKDFFLTVGRVELRKNILRLLEAFSLYQKQGGQSKLIFAGPPGFGYDRFLSTLKALKLQNVVTLGFVEENLMNGLYFHAQALVFPSLYEGFGLPILEAFSYSLPVLTGNFGATKEVAGNAALLVDPYSVAEIASGLRRLEEDTKLREALIARGKKRLQDFSWVKAAQKLKALFENL